MILGYDVSNYSGYPVPDTVRTLRNRFGLQRCSIGLQNLDIAAAWASACAAEAVDIEAYVETYNDTPLSTQLSAPDVVTWLQRYRPAWVNVTLEDVNAPRPDAGAIADGLAALRDSYGAGRPCLYTASWYWDGNPDLDVSALAPLWAAVYTNRPPLVDTGFDVGFGGWVRARCVQYAGNVTLLGVSMDLDAWS